MNIYLIGYRATGKSAVGRMLAGRLGMSWCDADDEIERQAGRTISEIFREQGEPGFRDWEAKVVAELAARDGCVVSLGGGAVLREENRSALRGGTTVWLSASPETVFQRMHADPATARRRPSLTAQGGMAEIQDLLSSREPLYRQCANIVIDTDGKTAAGVTQEVMEALGDQKLPDCRTMDRENN